MTQDITDVVDAKAAETEMHAMIQLAGEVAKLGGWALDLCTGMVEISPVTAALYDLPDLRQKPMAQAFDFYTAESRARIETAVARSIENRTGFDENLAMVSASGVLRQVRVAVQPVLSDDGQHLVRLRGAMQDVTELNLALSKVADAEKLLEIAGATAKFGAWHYDVLAGSLKWSRQTARIHDQPDGYTPSVAEGIDYYVPEDKDRIAALFQSCIDHGEPFDDTFEIISAKGRRFCVRATGEAERDETGRIVAVLGSFQDINELVMVRKRAEESDKLLEIAGRAVRLGGWSVSLANQKVFWSDGVASIHELPAGTMPTFEGGIDYFAPEDQEEAQKVFDACAKDGVPFDNVRELITAKGNRIKVRSLGEPVFDGTGKIIAVQGAMQDVTDLMTAQAENTRLATKIQETIDGLPEPFLFLDQDLRLTYLNRQAETVLGSTLENLVGREFFACLPGFAGTQLAVAVREAIVTRKSLQVTEQIDSLGRTFAFSVYPVADHLALFLWDVTEGLERAAQLNLLESAVSRLNDIILITQAVPLDGPDNPKIIYVNDAFVRRTGYSREEVIGKSPRMLQGPKTQRTELDRIRGALAARQPVRAELINYSKTGQEYWLELEIVPIEDEKGALTHFVAIQRDVTKRKNAEDELRLSEARFRMIAEATGTTVWECDIANGQEWWSEGLPDIFGHKPNSVGVETDVWRANVHPDDLPRTKEAWDRLLSGQADLMHDFYRFRRADGTWAMVEDRAFAFRDEEGRAVRVLGCMADISERTQLQDQLRQAQKLEAVGQLTGGVAHDFNNLLTVILGSADALSEVLSDRPDLQSMAEMTVAAAQRGAELTGRLLAFSRKQPLEPKAVDVNHLVQGLHGMLRRTLPESVDIELVRSAGLWSAFIDAGQMETALLNLAINARDAMGGHGHLTIETSNSFIDEQYASQHEEVKSGQYVMIAVTDTGCGMSSETLERVFEPFFTTKEVGQGSGLGLSMVYGYVKQSGGQIKIYSEVSVGTTIKLYVPRAATMKVVASADTRLTVPAGKGEHILVVEDNDLVRDVLVSQLQSLNYRTSIAENGMDALAIIGAADDLDLLFTDVVLPGGMNGRQLVDAVRLIRPELRVLYTSGYTENAVVHQGRLDVGVELLSKPYRRQELASKLRKVFETIEN